MRIVQVVMPGSSEYERKSQRVDLAALAPQHEIIVAASIDEARTSGAQVAHVYASSELPSAAFVGFRLPYVATADVAPSRWPWRKAAEPDFVVSPLVEKVGEGRVQALPEAVEERYWEKPLTPALAPLRRREGEMVVGSFARNSVRNMVEQTLARIHRFREDVSWTIFDHVPSPEDLAGVDVWADPAVDDADFDGFVAEALVAGLPVVAARTRINSIRLEKGRTGALVPPRDPNEMTHAILAALFKPEVARPRQTAAQQTVSKFRARQRVRVLAHMYETLIS